MESIIRTLRHRRYRQRVIIACILLTVGCVCIYNWPFFVLLMDNFPPWPCDNKSSDTPPAIDHSKLKSTVFSNIIKASDEILDYSKTKPGLTFATGASGNHFRELQGLLKSFNDYLLQNKDSQYRHSKLIVYNLGLWNSQKRLIKEDCKFCIYKEFDFERYPAHVANLLTYAWKAVIINSLLQSVDTVLWMDSSARFITSDISPFIKHAQHNGIAAYGSTYVVSSLTHADMFKSFGADPCDFRSATQIEANFIAVSANTYAKQVMLPLWLSCALDEKCIAPRGSRTWPCGLERSPQYTGCHRFDQAALTLLLYMSLYGSGHDMQPWICPTRVGYIDRSDFSNSVKFFNRTLWF